MPSYRGITITLNSQYDGRSLPESAPPPPPRNEDDIQGSSAQSSAVFRHTIEVSIPAYPGSQFWITYSCDPPPPSPQTSSPTDPPRVHFYFFKLIVQNQCLLSWGIGERDAWAGKTMFGIYPTCSKDVSGNNVLEKRAFVFPTSTQGQGDDSFEIRVFRAKARMRVPTRAEDIEGIEEVKGGFRLASAGKLKGEEPKRRYIYALIDPVDGPHAVFRFHCRSATQLQSAGRMTVDDEDAYQKDNDSSSDLSSDWSSMLNRPAVPPKDSPQKPTTNSDLSTPLSHQTQASHSTLRINSEVSFNEMSPQIIQEIDQDSGPGDISKLKRGDHRRCFRRTSSSFPIGQSISGSAHEVVPMPSVRRVPSASTLLKQTVRKALFKVPGSE